MNYITYKTIAQFISKKKEKHEKREWKAMQVTQTGDSDHFIPGQHVIGFNTLKYRKRQILFLFAFFLSFFCCCLFCFVGFFCCWFFVVNLKKIKWNKWIKWRKSYWRCTGIRSPLNSWRAIETDRHTHEVIGIKWVTQLHLRQTRNTGRSKDDNFADFIGFL